MSAADFSPASRPDSHPRRPLLTLKIGSSTLTGGTDRLSYGKIEDIARQLSEIRREFDVVLVSSGAIATARQFVEIEGNGTLIASKQALSAIGQPMLMRIFDEVFRSFGLRPAQCLLTHRDFENDTARLNTRNTMSVLLAHGYVPVVNENDTVSTEEIVLGDNDRLSAMVATVLGADRLVIASDIDGLYTAPPHLDPAAEFIHDVTDLRQVAAYASGVGRSGQGTGGMYTKVLAAEICLAQGVEMWILNGRPNGFLTKAMQGRRRFTRFRPADSAGSASASDSPVSLVPPASSDNRSHPL